MKLSCDLNAYDDSTFFDFFYQNHHFNSEDVFAIFDNDSQKLEISETKLITSNNVNAINTDCILKINRKKINTCFTKEYIEYKKMPQLFRKKSTLESTDLFKSLETHEIRRERTLHSFPPPPQS